MVRINRFYILKQTQIIKIYCPYTESNFRLFNITIEWNRHFLAYLIFLKNGALFRVSMKDRRRVRPHCSGSSKYPLTIQKM
jgi:hypothetical protein